ncbi:SDR family oxidoreductase [Mesorhizobium sp. DCY119]|uniref:SDR family NAD(P)-dependent oxidoreductase n=1 Tax=Mesorhizobium sp. DCY119 TaxID=2108445 RepID=UPI0014031607|nr:SDR family oxidoreductase [Mesorhizobium sp. DCY119]
MRLKNKTCLITGASGGIGLAMVEAFLAEGATVVATDLDAEILRERCASLVGSERVLARRLDVTKPDSIAALEAELAAEGVLVNVLVNNAAAITIGKLLDATVEDLRLVFGVNVEGLFNVTKGFLPGMIARGGGTVLNMASLASVRAMHERFAYSASKAAIAMMTRSIAVDYVGQGIRANCICPARVHTPFIENYLTKYYPGEEEQRLEALSRYQPIGRMIQPAEVASMAVYLCSDESAMVTGGSFVIDGGVMAGDQPLHAA